MLRSMSEQVAADSQPGTARDRAFPDMQGLFIGKAEDNLEFVVIRGRSKYARVETAGEVCS